VRLTPCHWVAIADVSKQCIAFILTNSSLLIPNLFETSLGTARNYTIAVIHCPASCVMKRSVALTDRLIDLRLTGKDLEGSRPGPVGFKYRNFTEISEEEHEILYPR
jgi:hypothetical protein